MKAEAYYDLEAACEILKPHVLALDDWDGISYVIDWVHMPAADRELCDWAWALLQAAGPKPPTRVIPAPTRAWGTDKTPRKLSDSEWLDLVRAAITRYLDRLGAQIDRRQAELLRDAAAAERAALLEAKRLGVFDRLRLAPGDPTVVSQMVKLRKNLAAIRAEEAAFVAECARRAAADRAAKQAAKQAALDRKAAKLAAAAAAEAAAIKAAKKAQRAAAKAARTV